MLEASPSRQYDLAVYIGRFQPFHHGHLSVVKHALEIADRVLILIGSSNRARDTRNPFTYQERKDLIWGTISRELDTGRVVIRPLPDDPYNKTAWIENVQREAKAAISRIRPRICLMGNVRDATSDYLTWFSWPFEPTPDTGFNATELRRALFTSPPVDFMKRGWSDIGIEWDQIAPPEVLQYLTFFRDSPVYPYLISQQAAERAYREKWGEGPFITVDPVIVKSGHVLMIERGGEEGTGSIGLPGGFLNPGETVIDGAVREGIEETQLFVSNGAEDAARKRLMGYRRGEPQLFDDPLRSRRGHLITLASMFVLPDGDPGLPEVKAASDAKSAFWKPISEIDPAETFEDHAFIIERMLNLYL